MNRMKPVSLTHLRSGKLTGYSLTNAEGKRVQLVSIKENLDTFIPQVKLMLTMSGLAEFERAIILERQWEGIAITKAIKAESPSPSTSNALRLSAPNGVE